MIITTTIIIALYLNPHHHFRPYCLLLALGVTIEFSNWRLKPCLKTKQNKQTKKPLSDELRKTFRNRIYKNQHHLSFNEWTVIANIS